MIFVTLSRWAIRISDKGDQVYAVAVFGVAILTLFLRPRFDRQPIQGDVEAHGGNVIRILFDWFGTDFGRYGRPTVSRTRRAGANAGVPSAQQA